MTKYERAEPDRRQVTVLFCDMVGSSALSTRLDPEDLRDLIHLYQRTCTAEIERFGGTVTRYVGDGILSLFGFPKVHEDDAERAIHAGLAMVARIRALGIRVGDAGETMSIRVGIASGLVVAGDFIGAGASEEAAVTGEAPNIAARLQQRTHPNTVLVHETTKEQAGARFAYRRLRPLRLAGFRLPVRAWRVLSPRHGVSRFESARAPILSPLVARTAELETLLEAWAASEAGRGQVVLLCGEAGIGKSRLAGAFEDRLAVKPPRIVYQCSSYHQESALHPFIEEIEHAAALSVSDTASGKREKLRALLPAAGEPAPVGLAILADLLSIPDESGSNALESMSAHQRRERTFEILLARLRDAAAAQTLLAIVEDLHWIDPTSLELVRRSIELVRTRRILLILTYRPEFSGLKLDAPHVREIALGRLADAPAARLVSGMLGRRKLARRWIDRIVERAEGVPLFLEEIARALLDRPASSLASAHSLPVPPSVWRAPAARLDGIGDAREVAQLGAVLGRAFSYGPLLGSARLSQAALDVRLERLLQADLIYQEGDPGEKRYAFRHVLVRDSIYAGLLREQRRELHRRIADTLCSDFPESVKRQPEVVAQHQFEALRYRESAELWLLAGRAAVTRSANVEAAVHLRRALSALQRLGPEDAELAARLELSIQLTLGAALTAAEGFASPGVEGCYARARELCAASADPAELLPVLCGLGSFYTVRGDLASAHTLAERMLELGANTGCSDLQLWGHVALGVTQLNLGSLASAETHLSASLSLYDPARHAHHALLFGQDARIIGLIHLSRAAWLLGRPEQALAEQARALELARELSHPFSYTYALAFGAWLAQLLSDPASCAHWADAAIASAREHGFALLLAGPLVARGWAACAGGDPAAGLEIMREGLALYEATGAELTMPGMLGLLALVLAQTGDLGGALRTADSARRFSIRHRELIFRAEIERLIAELTLTRSDVLSASGRARRRKQASLKASLALKIARAQGAPMLILRAALTRVRAASTPQQRRAALRDLDLSAAQFPPDSPLVEVRWARSALSEGPSGS